MDQYNIIFVWTKVICWPVILLEPIFFWNLKIFSDLKYFLDQYLFWPTIFVDKKFFQTQKFIQTPNIFWILFKKHFGPTVFLDSNVLRPKIFCGLKISLGPKSLDTWFFWTKIFFRTKCLFWTWRLPLETRGKVFPSWTL